MGRTRWSAAVALVLASAGAASAQTVVFEPGLDADPFVVTSDPTSIALTESASPLPRRTLALGLALRVGGPPLHLCLAQAGEPGCAVEGDLVSDRFSSDLTAAFGFGRFGLHAQLPIVLYQSSDFDPEDGEDALASTGLGDLRAGAKAWLWRGAGLTLGWDLTLTLPTSGGANFIGSPGVTLENRGLATWRRGRFAAAAGLGYAWRSHEAQLANLYVNDEVVWSVGGEVAIRPPTTVGLALFGRIGFLEPDDPRGAGIGAEELPVELLLAGRHRLTPAWQLELGLGRGLDQGYGAPSYRVLAGVRWTRAATRRPPPPPPPEPVDPDPDRDTILDPADACPAVAEDVNGYEDDDGCPEGDDDHDGLPNPTDACPQEPEDVDGIQDEDGCPEVDIDGDGVLDEVDACSTDPEDRDELLDQDGCPETDADQDSFTDDVDQCPLEAEVFNDRLDTDGCPDEGRGKVTITSTSIEIADKIFFDVDKAKIKRKSHAILDAVAAVLKSYDTLVVEIQGHTDDQGSETWNLDLSQRRAEAVRDYLVKQGVAADRLSAVGYGYGRPLEEGTSKKARSKNRRVEFVIIEDAPATGSPAR